MTTKKTLPGRFWEKVKIIDDKDSCWEWQAGCFSRGYGAFRFKGKLCRAHRVSYKLVFGEIPDGMDVLHSCDNKKCVRPKHLFPGSHADNMKDMAAKNRSLFGNKNPMSKLAEDDVREIRQTDLSRQQAAEKWGVSPQCISQIWARETWAYVI